MLTISPASWAFAVGALLTLPAMAQHPHHHQHHPTPPASAAVVTPAPLPYTSALQGYQTHADEKVRPWKESNTTVKTIGGWRAYAKEAAEPDPQAGPPPAAAAAAAAAAPKAPAAPADPHAGHGKP